MEGQLTKPEACWGGVFWWQDLNTLPHHPQQEGVGAGQREGHKAVTGKEITQHYQLQWKRRVRSFFICNHMRMRCTTLYTTMQRYM